LHRLENKSKVLVNADFIPAWFVADLNGLLISLIAKFWCFDDLDAISLQLHAFGLWLTPSDNLGP